MEITQAIVDYIKRNRVSTTEVTDALGKKGTFSKLQPINEDQFRVGRIHCVFAANDSNWDVHEQIVDVQRDDVIVIFTHNIESRALIGELVAKYTLLYREASAIVVDGNVRDIGALKRERFAIWCKGTNPIGCFNKKVEPFPEDEKTSILNRYQGGIAVCDEGGVVIIEKELHSPEMLERLERIEMQEDLWFFCLDTLKWNTKKIVCDKDYLKNTEEIPEVFHSKLERLSSSLDNR